MGDKKILFKHVNHNFQDIKVVEQFGIRYYITPEGKRYPSVTTVLGSNPLKRRSIAEWKRRVGDDEAARISNEAAEQGSAMHLMIERLLKNEPDHDQTNNQHAPMLFKSIKPVLLANIGKIHGLEVPLWSDNLKVAGRCDCIAEWRGKLSIIDFKTSMKTKRKEWIENYFQQATAYACMFEDLVGIPVTQVVILIAVRNSIPQVFVEKRNDWLYPLLDEIDRYYELNKEG